MAPRPSTGETPVAPLLHGRERVLAMAAMTLAVGGLVWLQFQRQEKAPAGSVEGGAVTTRPVEFEQLRGIALQLSNGCDTHPYDKFINEIADTGANTILFVVSAYQQNCGSSSLFIEARVTQPERRLHELIQLAHHRGMKVVLMPIVLLENWRTDEWRGMIDPEKDKNTWDDWWEDYTNYLLYYAAIAEATKVDVFMVGSELLSTEGQTDRWTKLIELVRKNYQGYLGYSANWDHYKSIAWWDKLDIIGMTTYYALSSAEPPKIEQLRASWADIKKGLLEWQAKIGKPLLFTEVGWPNQKTCAKEPWNYYAAPKSPAPELQDLCFQSFFEAWGDEPALGGYIIWEWRGDDRWCTDPETDTTYCPRQKPAMRTISRHFALPNGPAGRPSARPASQPAAVDSGR